MFVINKIKTVLYTLFVWVLGKTFLSERFIASLAEVDNEEKTRLYKKIEQSLGGEYIYDQVLAYIKNGGIEHARLYSDVRKILTYKYIYTKVINNLHPTLISKEDLYQDTKKFLGYAYLYNHIVKDSKQHLSELPIDEQFQTYKALLPEYASVFASQEGEDILLKRVMKSLYVGQGFYVDVGAHDPLRFSNTLHYYLRGWQGINIDPIPGMKSKFDALRPKDINLEVGVSQLETELDYYQFEEPAYNTFSKESYLRAKEMSPLTSITKVTMKPLKQILNESMPESRSITFMSIDVEGLEMEVLLSSDWHQYRPKLVCIEALSFDKHDLITEFMMDKDYSQVASTKNSNIYIENTFYQTL